MRNAAVLASLVISSSAWAAATDFSAGSWVIPMDVCYQPSQSFDGSNFSGTDETSSFYGTCPDVTSATHHDGVLKSYGLIYRFLQHSIPVYYILNPNKTTADGTDFTITNSGTTPVARLSHTTWTNIEFMNAAHTSISYRGAPFIISAADVPAALNLMKTDPDFTFTDSRTGRVVFRDVHIHVAKTNILQAPVRSILNQVPPKIALLDIGGAALGVLEGYLKDSGLYTATATKYYPTIGDVFTAFDNVSDFTTSDGLAAGGFKILWAPHWDGANNTATERDDIVAKIAAFVDAGHPMFAQCAALATMEGADAPGTSNDTAASNNGHFQVTASGTTKGLVTNVLPQQPFPAVAGDKIVVNPDNVVKAYLNPLSQTGDYNLKVNVGSFAFDFQPASGYAYRAFTQSLIQSVSNTGAQNGLQIESVANKDGNPTKGQIIYLGGHSYGSQGSTCAGSCSTFAQNNTLGMERLILNTLLFLGQDPQTIERTRSAPIVYSDGKTYLGSYVQKTSAGAAFPPWDGHFREYPANALSGANVTSFNLITANWDAATHVANQANADTRVIFTAVPVSSVLTQTAFITGNLTALQATVPTLTTAMITAIRQGGLGGIDHSIPAIIGPSQVAGSSSRPTVAYFGALDGMVHAILVSGTVSGKSPGDELWAFIPPSQLLKTTEQSGGVDGSPSVGDAFIDPTNSGTKTWHTVLGVTDGSYAGGTIDVLDITDPTNPGYLWSASDSVTASGYTFVMGRAQGAAISPVMVGGTLTFAYFLATDNTTGTAGNGFNIYALNVNNGNVLWRVNHTYPNSTVHNDVPGTVAVIDAAGDAGPATKLYFGGIEGKVWSVDAATGANATAIYDAPVAYGAAGSVDYPIESGVVLYRDPSNSHLSLLGVTGGADWVPSSTLSHVFRIDTVNPAVYANLLDLAAGERVYAVPTIYGNAAYLITSQGTIQGATGTDFNANGSILRINLGATAGVTTLGTVKQGAAEVAIDSNGNVVAASISGLTQNGNSGRDVSQSTIALQNAAAKQLTIRAWLDLH